MVINAAGDEATIVVCATQVAMNNLLRSSVGRTDKTAEVVGWDELVERGMVTGKWWEEFEGQGISGLGG